MLRVSQVVGRHDLHAVLVEYVLNVGVELADRQCALRGGLWSGIRYQLLFDKEIRQRRLNYVGWRLGQDAMRAARRLEQHGVDLPPRR